MYIMYISDYCYWKCRKITNFEDNHCDHHNLSKQEKHCFTYY